MSYTYLIGMVLIGSINFLNCFLSSENKALRDLNLMLIFRKSHSLKSCKAAFLSSSKDAPTHDRGTSISDSHIEYIY